MLNGALLGIIEDAATAVLTLTEGVEESEFLASRLTRAEVRRQLNVMGNAFGDMPAMVRARMPELEWSGWDSIQRVMKQEGGEADEAMWFAISSLVPATLMWLRVYRKDQPGLFDFAV